MPDAPARAFPIAAGSESEVVDGWLDWQRATVHRKCLGLSEEMAATYPIPTSQMSIRGLVSHLAWVEVHWFQTSFLGSVADPDPDSGWSSDATLDAALARYAQACGTSREITAAHALDELERYAPPGLPIVSLRWIAGHVLEETARHLGHLDLLREAIDGERGY
jgi:hypothetical protein